MFPYFRSAKTTEHTVSAKAPTETQSVVTLSYVFSIVFFSLSGYYIRSFKTTHQLDFLCKSSPGISGFCFAPSSLLLAGPVIFSSRRRQDHPLISKVNQNIQPGSSSWYFTELSRPWVQLPGLCRRSRQSTISIPQNVRHTLYKSVESI